MHQKLLRLTANSIVACSSISTVQSKAPGAHSLDGVFIQQLHSILATKQMKKRVATSESRNQFALACAQIVHDSSVPPT